MDRLAELARQLVDLVQQHVPADAIPPTVPTAVVLLFFGVGVSVLGAKFARWFITVFFAVGGLVAGLAVSQRMGISPPFTALVGCVVIGGLGYSLYRCLVGLGAGVFLTIVAFSVLSVQMVVPHLDQFPNWTGPVPVAAATEEGVGTAEQAIEATWEQLKVDLHEFGNYIIQREPNLERYAGWAVAVAGIVGFLMGVFFCRMTLIVFCAAFGTFLITSGICLLQPNVLQTQSFSPEMSSLTLLSFFAVSLVLQAILTRPEPVLVPVARESD